MAIAPGVRRPLRSQGYEAVCTAGVDLAHLSFGLCRLEPGAAWSRPPDAQEVVAVVIRGRVDVGAGTASWSELGGRVDVWDGPATAVYAPPGTVLELAATRGPALVAVIGSPVAPGLAGPDPYAVGPDDVRVQQRGRHPFARSVHDIVGADRPGVRLLVGETFNAVGEWSSYPPHKHDVHGEDGEVPLEEVYYFRLTPRQGFGAQFVYTEDASIDAAWPVRHGDIALLPRGYHPVAAAPGYRLYYLWALAGEARRLRPHDDPAHTWVHTAEH